VATTATTSHIITSTDERQGINKRERARAADMPWFTVIGQSAADLVTEGDMT
jgi:hypothetical protein